jgi:transcriptional regulator with XRE-family HTH domain
VLVARDQAGGRVSRVRGRRLWEVPYDQCVVVGANIRALRLSKGWSQQTLGELMGWAEASTVCAAEGHRSDRQRGFTVDELVRLATIFGVPIWRLVTQCENCGGRPPAGFACLSCSAARDAGGRAITVNGGHPPQRRDQRAVQQSGCR